MQLQNINKYFSRFLLLTLVLLYTLGFAQKAKDKLQKDKKDLEKEITYTNKLLKDTKKKTKISLNQLMILNKKISMREELISNISGEIYNLDDQISDNTAIITALTNDLRSLKEEYAKMIYYAYKNRSAYNYILFVFSASDFNQAYKRLKYIQQYSEHRKKQAELIVMTEKVLNSKVNELAQKKYGKQILLKDKESEKQELAKEKDEKNLAIKDLKVKERDLLKTLKEKENSARKLQKAIETIIAEEIRKASELAAANKLKKKNATTTTNNSNTNNTTSKTTPNNAVSSTSVYDLTPEEQTISNSFSSNKGKLPWPTERGVITSTFGEHPHPILTGIKTINNGVDITTTTGAYARAVFDGKVTGVVSIPGANKAVIVRHGEYLSVYSNLSTVFVSNGDKVKTKQNIGIIAVDEDDNKTELHLEIWKNKLLQNPASWITGK